MFGSKAPLAMLSDHANRHLFSPAELAAIDRVLPWTRMVRPGPVTLEDGHPVDLLDYAVSHASDLVLKPALLHGGIYHNLRVSLSWIESEKMEWPGCADSLAQYDGILVPGGFGSRGVSRICWKLLSDTSVSR